MANWWDGAPAASPMDQALTLEGVTGKRAELARSIYQQESSSGADTATSNAGAVGGMQVIPSTFNMVADKGWNINDPVQNARAGVRYVGKMMDAANDDPRLAAIGYYGGPGAITKAQSGTPVSDPRNPNAPDTFQYAGQVVARMPQDDWWKSAPLAGNDVTDTAPGIDVTLHYDEAPKGNAADGGVMAGIARGIRDPIDAGAQMLRRAVPESVGNAVDRFGNFLADEGLPIARTNGVAGLDQSINSANTQYEADRVAAGRGGGTDWARLTGTALGTLPAVAALPAGAGIVGRAAAGAVQGGVAGTLTPVFGADAQRDFSKSKAEQIQSGALMGGIAGPAFGALGRVVSPKASQAGSQARLLSDEGVQLTPGQALGGAAMTIEDKMMSLPVLGDAIRAARSRGNETLNRAVYNRVLAPIGESTDALGRGAVADAAQKVSQAYDDVLSGVRLTVDPQLRTDVQAIAQRVAQLTPTESRSFGSIVNREVLEPLSNVKMLDGQGFKQIESQLGQSITRYASSTDAHQKEVASSLKDVLDALRATLARQNPQAAQRLQSINQSYAMLARLETAAGKIGAHDGVFTPQQLAQAIRQSDRTVRRRGYARGDAMMQDLSDAAQSRMSATIPNSGTTDRFLLNAAALGGGAYVSPALVGSLLASTIPYLPGVSRAATALVMKRPANVQALANALRALPAGALGALAGLSN